MARCTLTSSKLPLPCTNNQKPSPPQQDQDKKTTKWEGRWRGVAGQSWVSHVGLPPPFFPFFLGGGERRGQCDQSITTLINIYRDHQSWVSHVGSLGNVACLLKASLWHFCLRSASTGGQIRLKSVQSLHLACHLLHLDLPFGSVMGALAIGSDLRVVSKFRRWVDQGRSRALWLQPVVGRARSTLAFHRHLSWWVPAGLPGLGAVKKKAWFSQIFPTLLQL